MNRIYQGRVTAVQITNPDETARETIPWAPLDPDVKRARELGETALWEHHQHFQDAVNYYIVALASLGVSPESKLTKLRGLLAAVWDSFNKKGQRREGMGESLRRAWQLEKAPSLTKAIERFHLPLKKHCVSDQEMELAGESLIHDLGGEGSVQQGGPEYWPYFCQSGFLRGVTFPRSAEQLAKEDAQSQMATWVWNTESVSDIARLHQKLAQSFFCNLVAGKGPLDEKSCKELFAAALDALHANNHINADQKTRWAESLEKKVPLVAVYAGGSINKEALKARFYAFLVFKHLSPDEIGLDVLRSVYPKPEPTQQTRNVTRGAQNPSNEIRLRSLGDDPIKLVRDKAYLIFRAFTALPIWKCDRIGKGLHERSAFREEIERGELHYITWKDFDIAAFKEALKVYNQFQQNIKKRDEKLDALATRILVMDGERAITAYVGDTELDSAVRSRLARIWDTTGGKPKPPKSESGEDAAVVKFASDARIDRLRQIVNDDLAEEYRLTDGRPTPYGLRRRTMKGWSDVKRKWQAIVRKANTFSETKRAELKSKLDELRSGEKREQIGSHLLFEALLKDEAAWSIWREPDEPLVEQIAKNEWASDPLEAFREYCEAREALEEVTRRPLNFTPADARHSRRLFMFTDCCSFGNDRGEYRHDPEKLAVTVPVAWKDDSGCYSVQLRRLVYAAPRLLRDGIRAEDGGYAQDWIQPMMRSLFGETSDAVNPQELKESAVQLMPDFDAKGQRRILLNFPLDLNEARVHSLLRKAALWNGQFHSWRKGEQQPFLRWPGEFDGKEPHRWWEQVSSFAVLSTDLGTRHAASVALVEASRKRHDTSRFIGKAGGHEWFARYLAGMILRLPGENAQVRRPRSKLDKTDTGPFREELYGARGRRASQPECKETIAIVADLKQSELLDGITIGEELCSRLSFPEQNDKLLIALRRAQNWIATCVSWHWKLTQPDGEEQRRAAVAQIREHNRIADWKTLAKGDTTREANLRDVIRDHILRQREVVQHHLLAVTHRILPLRNRIWEWLQHPDKPDCHLLRQTKPSETASKVLLGGQRGLSLDRIEQLSELRRRWQSLNQALRRELGQKPLTASEMRNDPIPDPCPDILRKLENIREQRVNQTAHHIMVQALGLKLRVSQLAPATRATLDMHGEYEVARPPVDIIVLEDLSRYLSDQGRAKSENTRLMKWCHRAITQKVKMLAEPFGIPVLETSAAYSSRFCSLTGVAGFRAVEVGWEDRYKFRWRVLRKEAAEARAEHKEPSANAAHAEALFRQLEEISKSSQPHRTLLAPQLGGPMFVVSKPVPHPSPSPNRKHRNCGEVLPMQADINAAINLAFRAIAHPACAGLHHRLRTLRKPGAKNKPEVTLTRETRRFGKDGIAVLFCPGHTLPKERNSNLFFDEHGVADFGRAQLAGEAVNDFPYASGPGLWEKVNKREFQWQRCLKINQGRLGQAQSGAATLPDEIPM